MRLSLFLSYTASILFVPGGRPNQKFWIRAGLRDTKDPSRLVLQNCAPIFLEKSVDFTLFSKLFFKPHDCFCSDFCQVNSEDNKPPTFKKEDLSPDICHSIKTSLTALVERGVRPGNEIFVVVDFTGCSLIKRPLEGAKVHTWSQQSLIRRLLFAFSGLQIPLSHSLSLVYCGWLGC